MSNNNQRFQGCCPLTPIPKPPKQKCICPPGPRGPRGPQGEQGPPGSGAIESVFKATTVTPQEIPPGVLTKLLYPIEQFDTNNEYDQATSKFIAQENGVYSYCASIGLVIQDSDSTGTLHIIVNQGEISEREIKLTETVSGGLTILNPAVCTNFQLLAGDRVEVFLEVSTTVLSVLADEGYNQFTGTRLFSI
ncbi:hypothetical protein [Bacillus sp. NTK034]|uniref:hypothetical protein n=1 Tax=Bacillus sp. NTK034 TaxID=2802176 RepID=UPI001A8F685E|nr:hypothetical protein [Bacillus sp. NTK034]MBN8203173.1 hypothetical protein [Bacillus sp. NTK034]